MLEGSLLAAVDLGSNSFRLQIGRVNGEQIYPQDSLKETVRLAAGLTRNKLLDPQARDRGIGALARFGERLRGFPPERVRAVGTNTLRVAKDAADFIARGEQALGFPIDVIAGREEARLIYLGVAHSLPASARRRLVVDIGGGSTEFIIGRNTQAEHMESLYMGCVGYSLRYFPDGRIDKASLKQAVLAARGEMQAIEREFIDAGWDEAIGSSGTAKALVDILEANGYSNAGITREGLERLRQAMLKAGNLAKLDARGVPPDRIAVLGGGFAIMSALFTELNLERMSYADGALRLGVLYDLIGRSEHHDVRDATAREFMQRYHVDIAQAERVGRLAERILRQLVAVDDAQVDSAMHLLTWATRLHEVGVSIAHTGYHKHSAYILRFADMPGFSKADQERLAQVVLGHRGKLAKIHDAFRHSHDWAVVFALRLAALFCRSRTDGAPPGLRCRINERGYQIAVDASWLVANPLTEAALQQEVAEWRSIDFILKLRGIRADEAVTD